MHDQNTGWMKTKLVLILNSSFSSSKRHGRKAKIEGVILLSHSPTHSHEQKGLVFLLNESIRLGKH